MLPQCACADCFDILCVCVFVLSFSTYLKGNFHRAIENKLWVADKEQTGRISYNCQKLNHKVGLLAHAANQNYKRVKRGRCDLADSCWATIHILNNKLS